MGSEPEDLRRKLESAPAEFAVRQIDPPQDGAEVGLYLVDREGEAEIALELPALLAGAIGERLVEEARRVIRNRREGA